MTDDEREEKLDALRRYEQLRREQLGSAANLTFALASGGVGFCASLVTGKDQVAWTCPANYFFIAASALFIVAVVLSMCLMWTRLQDFRMTARKLRLELRNGDAKVIERVGAEGRLLREIYVGALSFTTYYLRARHSFPGHLALVVVRTPYFSEELAIACLTAAETENASRSALPPAAVLKRKRVDAGFAETQENS